MSGLIIRLAPQLVSQTALDNSPPTPPPPSARLPFPPRVEASPCKSGTTKEDRLPLPPLPHLLGDNSPAQRGNMTYDPEGKNG